MFVRRLYRERLSQVNSKLAEVEAGRAAEYLEPLAVLLENMQVRTKVAGKLNSLRPTERSRTVTALIHSSILVRDLPRLVSGVSQE